MVTCRYHVIWGLPFSRTRVHLWLSIVHTHPLFFVAAVRDFPCAQYFIAQYSTTQKKGAIIAGLYIKTEWLIGLDHAIGWGVSIGICLIYVHSSQRKEFHVL